MNVNCGLLMVLAPLGVVTTTLAGPAVCAGVTAMIVVALTTEKLFACVVPKVTELAPTKFVPVIVT